MEGVVASTEGHSSSFLGAAVLPPHPGGAELAVQFQDTAVMLPLEIEEYPCCGGFCHSYCPCVENTTVMFNFSA